jgi:rare lipoprotein A
MRIYLLGFAIGVTLAWSPTFRANPLESKPSPPPEIKYEVGVASWYGEKFQGRITASGETYDMNGLTAAHRTLPLGTWVELTNLGNQRSVTVRINDRGPFIRGREIDVSKATARALGFVGAGLTTVRMELVSSPSSGKATVAPSPKPDAVRSESPDAGST